MQTAPTTTADSNFTAHLISTPKREWSIAVEGIPFVIVRSTPDGGTAPTAYASYYRDRV